MIKDLLLYRPDMKKLQGMKLCFIYFFESKIAENFFIYKFTIIFIYYFKIENALDVYKQ